MISYCNMIFMFLTAEDNLIRIRLLDYTLLYRRVNQCSLAWHTNGSRALQEASLHAPVLVMLAHAPAFLTGSNMVSCSVKAA